MAIWFQIAIVLNVVYWAIFFYLLSRRRWTWMGLAVGLFHMFFAGVVSVAPFRSLLDPDYTTFALGLLQFNGRAASLPAALILAWALTAAWVAVGKGRGRLMLLITIGGLFFGVNMCWSLIQSNPGDWEFQLGEYFSISGVRGLLVLIGLFAMPFLASAIWAAKRSRFGGTTPPLASDAQDRDAKVEPEHNDTNGFQYSEGCA